MSTIIFAAGVGENLFDSEHENWTNDQKISKIKHFFRDLELETDHVNIEIEGSKVRLSGSVATQEQKEKIILAAGNIKGINKVIVELEVDEFGIESNFYTVKPGDTLQKISTEMYENASNYEEILKANEPFLKNPNDLYPGLVLRIPPSPGMHYKE